MLYSFFIFLYGIAIRSYALFNRKASLWLACRKNVWQEIKNTQRNNEVYWFHCASLGEFEQAMPLIEKIKNNNKNIHCLVSFFSPSGFLNYKKSTLIDEVICLPLDTKANAKKIIEIVKPTKVFFIKYEFWYNLLFELKKREISTYLVSGIFRNDQVFFKAYGGFFRRGLACFTHFFVQNEESKTLLNGIHFQNVTIAGDTRFDRVVKNKDVIFEDEKIEKFVENKKIIVAGSTWLEDEILLKKVLGLLGNNWRIIIATHDVNEESKKRIKRIFKNDLVFYSEIALKEDPVLAIDKIGLLSLIYRYADICYVGGGFGKGIHNILEAIVYNKPVVFGKNYMKFEEAKRVIELGIGKSVAYENEFIDFIKYYFENEYSLKNIIAEFVRNNTNAVDKIFEKI